MGFRVNKKVVFFAHWINNITLSQYILYSVLYTTLTRKLANSVESVSFSKELCSSVSCLLRCIPNLATMLNLCMAGQQCWNVCTACDHFWIFFCVAGEKCWNHCMGDESPAYTLYQTLQYTTRLNYYRPLSADTKITLHKVEFLLLNHTFLIG